MELWFRPAVIRYKNLSAAVENTDLVQFEIAYSGQLPCEATLSYRVGSHYPPELLLELLLPAVDPVTFNVGF